MAGKLRSSWNHRVVRHEAAGESWYQVHEIYYDPHGRPVSMTKTAPIPMGTSVADLKAELTRMLEACRKPVFKEPKGWRE